MNPEHQPFTRIAKAVHHMDESLATDKGALFFRGTVSGSCAALSGLMSVLVAAKGGEAWEALAYSAPAGAYATLAVQAFMKAHTTEHTANRDAQSPPNTNTPQPKPLSTRKMLFGYYTVK